MSGKRGKVIFLEEVIDTHAQKFRHQTNMIAVIKPAQKVDTVAKKSVSEFEPHLLKTVKLTFDL
jgi:hypothetical protein